MAKIDHALAEFRQMDELAVQESPVHSLNPVAKLITTIVYIFTVVSFPKYNLTGMLVFVVYPLAMFELAGIPVGTCFRKLKVVLPLVCAVGLFNPFFDRTILLRVGTLAVSGGVISMLTLMLKGIFSLMASFIMVATTPVDRLCGALRRVHVPTLLVTLFLLTYRYVGLMIEETSVMTDAYRLRAPGQKGIHISAWGSFLGQLLLRSMDRAEELYNGMLLRGFHGCFCYSGKIIARPADYAYAVLCCAAFLLLRYVNLAVLLGSLVVR